MGVGKPGGRDWQRLLTSQPTGTLRTGELTGVYTFPQAQDSSERVTQIHQKLSVQICVDLTDQYTQEVDMEFTGLHTCRDCSLRSVNHRTLPQSSQKF